MQKLLAIAGLLVISSSAAVAQGSKSEQEVRSFLAAYDKAVAGRDIAFLERVLPGDYVYSGASGRMSDRAQVLSYFKEERDHPSYRMNSLKHENVVVRVDGNMAVVTNEYTAQTSPLDSRDAEPQTAQGRHTAVFEKRTGRWMVIAEQDTEQPHDDQVMERQVLAAAREYHELMKRLESGRSYAELEKGGDVAALERLLADDYTCTGRDGEIRNKAQELEGYKTTGITVESYQLSEQKMRVIDNGTAVEMGKIRYLGTNSGNQFDVTTRYTTTWVVRGAGWQLIASHSSMVRTRD